MFGTNQIRKQHLGNGATLRIQAIFPTIQGEGPFAGQSAIFVRLAGCNLRCYFCDTDFESRDRERDMISVVDLIKKMAHTAPDFKSNLVVITGGEPFLQNIQPFCKELVDEGFDVQIETAGTLWNPGFESLIIYDGVTLVCSPKTGKVHDKIAQFCQDWKYLIRAGDIDPHDGLPNTSTQRQGEKLKLARPPRKTDTVWLQPCEEYKVGYRTIDISKPIGWEYCEVHKHLMPDGKCSCKPRGDGLADQQVTSSVKDPIQTQKNIDLARDLAMKFNYRISLQIHKYLGIP